MNKPTCAGDRIAGGAYSTVFEHVTDPTKVVMTGYLEDDIVKLRLYAEIDALFSVEYDSQTGRYFAVLERMFDRRSTHDAGVKISSESERSYTTIRKQDDKNRGLLDLATDPNTTPRASRIFEWVFSCGVSWSSDFHEGNFLVDSNGEVLCVDGCNFHKPPPNVFHVLYAELNVKEKSHAETSESD